MRCNADRMRRRIGSAVVTQAILAMFAGIVGVLMIVEVVAQEWW